MLKSTLPVRATFVVVALCTTSLVASAAENDVGEATQLSPADIDASEPAWSPDGQHIAFVTIQTGRGTIATMNADGSAYAPIVDDGHDNREPVWSRDGEHLYFASNRAGDWDIWRVALADGALLQVTSLDGDEREPAVSLIEYTMSAAADDGCGPPMAFDIESYGKIAFTRGTGRRRAVWSIADNGHHLQQISPEGETCYRPAFANSGRRLAYVCGRNEGELRDTGATYEQDIAAAVALLDQPACTGVNTRDLRDRVREEPCLAALPRHYTSYEHTPRRRPEGVSQPSYSANETRIVDEGRVYASGSSRGHRLSLPAGARHVRWSPSGEAIAFSAPSGSGRAVFSAPTDFYMQDATNLWQYPELWSERENTRLADNSFVAFEGQGREFFTRYDEIAYQGRGTYVTVDAALQIFHDVFVAMLREAEDRGQADLLALSSVLAESYASSLSPDSGPRERWYATYFAVPAVLLAAAEDARSAAGANREAWLDEHGCWDFANCGDIPDADGAEMISEFAQARVDELSPLIQSEVRHLVARIVQHEGIGTLPFPTEPEAQIDYSHFAVRGHYENEGLHGYFMAMMWYALAALPVDEALIDFSARMESLEWVDGDQQVRRAIDTWRQLDAMVGSFLGRPIDATVSHLSAVLASRSFGSTPSEVAALSEALAGARGNIVVRGLEGATGGQRAMRFTFMPQRLGSDVEVIRRLTHPDLPDRYNPSALDFFAASGNARAVEHAAGAIADRGIAEAYAEATRVLTDERERANVAMDIYHVWSSALVDIANSASSSNGERHQFARTEAWQDRLLLSALAGYATLKHDAVLYSFQESGVQCGGDLSVYHLTERPVWPAPASYVDPMPEVFTKLSALSRMAMSNFGVRELHFDVWFSGNPSRDGWSLTSLLDALAAAAQREVDGEALTEGDEATLRYIGAILEVLFIGLPGGASGDGAIVNDTGRTQRGVAIATDIYTKVDSQQVLQLGVGRLLDLYVAVPSTHGRAITQGAAYSFYEFWHPMSQRLTDDAWNELLSGARAPALPEWSRSFVDDNGIGQP